MAKIYALILLIPILILGNKLREFSYASVPAPGEVADEYSFGWAGLSLIKNQYPIAWSGISAYKNHDFQKINVDGIYNQDPNRPAFSIDKPWLDHPPLFGLITGGYAYLKGARSFMETSVIFLRRPMLKIGILTTLLVFVFGWRLYGVYVGLISSLLYSTVPYVVISSRLALAENGYTPLFLSSLIFAHYYFEKKKFVFWYLAIFLAGIAIWFKLSAVAVFISLLLLAIFYGKSEKRKLVFNLAIALSLSTLAYIFYGMYFGWETFVNVLFVNSQRFYGASSEIFYQAVNQFRITTLRNFTDGWMLFGWIALFILSLSEFKKKIGGTFLTIAAFSYFTVFILFGSEAYGWYKFPFFPFLIIASARLILKLIENPNLFVYSALILLPIGTSLHRLLGVIEFQKYVPFLRIFSIFLLLIFLLSLLRPEKSDKFQKLFMVITLIFAIWLSIKEIFFYTIDKWYFVT